MTLSESIENYRQAMRRIYDFIEVLRLREHVKPCPHRKQPRTITIPLINGTVDVSGIIAAVSEHNRRIGMRQL